jgi:diketogulonate reductase-like aldo/keto reductase
MEYIKLNNGMTVPKIFFGTYRIHDNDDVTEVIRNAYDAGYRAFDSAYYYRNEDELRVAFDTLGIRDQVIVTSKAWTDADSYDGVVSQFRKSRKNLGKVDIYMLHWPMYDFRDRWKALEDLYLDGEIGTIAVANFKRHHLEELMGFARILPAINQIEAHCYLMDYDTISFCHENGIAVQAWRPLMRTGPMLSNNDISVVADRHGKTIAQVCLRFLLQKGVCIVPKSTRPERMKENISLFDFELDDRDMEFLNSLNIGFRTADDPDNFPKR